jgi:hypothetical protein
MSPSSTLLRGHQLTESKVFRLYRGGERSEEDMRRDLENLERRNAETRLRSKINLNSNKL